MGERTKNCCTKPWMCERQGILTSQPFVPSAAFVEMGSKPPDAGAATLTTKAVSKQPSAKRATQLKVRCFCGCADIPASTAGVEAPRREIGLRALSADFLLCGQCPQQVSDAFHKPATACIHEETRIRVSVVATSIV
ncbi:hypothetical protein [Loktanella sp. Alg231-35]|uniref:hypothetical protein n=1 Tax=Loktanella sp. Alg231-35 TaxID=1922220 RepID=UPI00131EF3E4|nr:hypothetical protein [Loktanella sp. Alg231-35]